MNQEVIKYLLKSFAWLEEKYEFCITNEVNEDQTYWIEYHSAHFIIKIEKYRREFYVTLYKTTDVTKATNLFNLLSYLNQSSENIPTANYFTNEKDLNECYKKQLGYLSTIIYNNFNSISIFFDDKGFDSRLEDLGEFILNKYPTLFKRQK